MFLKKRPFKFEFGGLLFKLNAIKNIRNYFNVTQVIPVIYVYW